MKVLVLATAFVAVSAPFAAASAEVERRAPQMRIESESPSGSSPTIGVTRQTPAPPPASATQTVAQREAAEAARAITERRRSGKRIPDAELIGPRGAL